MYKNNNNENLVYISEKDIEDKNITINDKKYIITTVYQDKKYGKIIKAITPKLKDFEKIFFREFNKKYIKITEEELLKYIYDNYEKVQSDVIIDDDM